MLPPLKGYQGQGIDRIDYLLERDPTTPVLGVGPCGCGKSRIMYELACRRTVQGKRVGILTHRQMLTDQLAADFAAAGMPHSILAAGYKNDPEAPIQIMSAPTVYQRCFRKGSIDLPELDLLLVDEAHQQTGKGAQAVMYGAIKDGMVSDGYIFRGTPVCGFTATPVQLKAGLYGSMVEFGSYSEMRAADMHQIVKVFSPDEIDVAGLRGNAQGDLSERELEKRIRGNVSIFGSVFSEYGALNPSRLPMILFAPSVESSKWFASGFCDAGVPVAHLDGEVIGLPEMSYPRGARLRWVESSAENRAMLMDMHREGEVKGICNRFVLREAVNMPWCYHAIFATVMGGLSTYLQAVGRLQRYWPSYDYKILQCHGGHYWRHGSPNEDREWKIGDTNVKLARARIEAIQKGKKPEGIRCPKCGGWRMRGSICIHCGHAHAQSVRAVRMLSGRLKLMEGRVFTGTPETSKVNSLWMQTLWGSSVSDRPVSSAVSIFTRKCDKAGLLIDWDTLKHRPPLPTSEKWHYSVNDYYPWLKRKRQK